MRFNLVPLLFFLLPSCIPALSQSSDEPASPPASALIAADAGKPRVFITDSNSWSTHGSAGGSGGTFGAASSGGARPQTAEIIKTFGQRCPQVTVNNRIDASNYIVELDHEGGKGLLAHKDKIAVFVQKSGDSIFSKSTLSVGGSVQDACAALIAHWDAHNSELRSDTNSSHLQHIIDGSGAASLSSTASSLTVDASLPNCDIEVDGNFMGSTPSILDLAPGKHQITVKKSGYQDRSRNMTLTRGTVRLNAEMVAK